MYCVGHDPTRVAERRRRSSKAGRAGGRGRASAELKRLQHRFEELADKVLERRDRTRQFSQRRPLLGGARACIRDALTAREQEELIERLERLEQALEQDKEGHHYAS
jgi:hypothetical protein